RRYSDLPSTRRRLLLGIADGGLLDRQLAYRVSLQSVPRSLYCRVYRGRCKRIERLTTEDKEHKEGNRLQDWLLLHVFCCHIEPSSRVWEMDLQLPARSVHKKQTMLVLCEPQFRTSTLHLSRHKCAGCGWSAPFPESK